MEEQHAMKVIARIRSDFTEKFGIPRQSGLVEALEARIVFEPEYRNPDAVRGMEGFSHIWLIWQFSRAVRANWSPTVRPPRLGGNERMGVFATRSPYRPNGLGLSSVRISRIDYNAPNSPVIHVEGADLMDGTPIYDIKPYLPYVDAHPEARGGFTDSTEWHPLEVIIPEKVKKLFSPETLTALFEVLRNDPRPQYHHDPERIYGMPFDHYDVRFRVKEGVVEVVEALKAAD